jgi:hypothetical protein
VTLTIQLSDVVGDREQRVESSLEVIGEGTWQCGITSMEPQECRKMLFVKFEWLNSQNILQ